MYEGVARDWRDDRIEELEAALTARDQRIAELERKLARLEELLGRNSTNSNLPPSTDSPDERRKRRNKEKNKRKKGAQPGHKARQRALLPPEKVNKFEDNFPDECEACHAELPPVVDATPLRHQVIDVPPVEPYVQEWRLHAAECDECGHHTRARLPDGVPRSMLGPRLLALIALLTGGYRLSRRSAATLLHDVLGVRISVGALSEAEQRVSEAVAPAVDEARQFVNSQPIKHVDGTTWSTRGEHRNLWTITTALVTAFAITFDGSKETVKKLLKRGRGILVSDRAGAFGFWAMHRRQICWAHLLRKFSAAVERGGRGSAIARQLHGTAEIIFHYWHRVRDGTMTRKEFRKWLRPVKQRVEHLLERGESLGGRGFRGVCANILEHREALWTFSERRGVEPTNNAAERDLRPGVIWRKTSYGTQSDRGERYAERIMTVTHTLRKQGRPVLDYLHRACADALYATPPPSLLPLTGSTRSNA